MLRFVRLLEFQSFFLTLRFNLNSFCLCYSLIVVNIILILFDINDLLKIKQYVCVVIILSL